MRAKKQNWSDISAHTGFAERTLRWQNARGWSSYRVRVAIEDNLGTPIFSPLHAFRERQKQKSLLGVCPVFATRSELRALARRLGVTCVSQYPNRRALLRELLARAAVKKVSS